MLILLVLIILPFFFPWILLVYFALFILACIAATIHVAWQVAADKLSP